MTIFSEMVSYYQCFSICSLRKQLDKRLSIVYPFLTFFFRKCIFSLKLKQIYRSTVAGQIYSGKTYFFQDANNYTQFTIALG